MKSKFSKRYYEYLAIMIIIINIIKFNNFVEISELRENHFNLIIFQFTIRGILSIIRWVIYY